MAHRPAQQPAYVLRQERGDRFDVVGLDHQPQDVEDGSGMPFGRVQSGVVQVSRGDSLALGDAVQERRVTKLLAESGLLERRPQRLRKPVGQSLTLAVRKVLGERLEHGTGCQLGLGA
jgi:hypothetical protein